MPSLLLVVFLVQLAIHLVNSIGAEKINELLWNAYNKFPTSTAAAHRDTVHLRRDVVSLKRELGATSAQDQFAKWAKLQREYDKALAAHDKKSESLRATKSSFSNRVTLVRWSSTNGLRFLLQFWYSKEPMFWLAKGWVPSYVEWLLSFPRAPRGSVSILIWEMACAYVIQMVASATASVILLEMWSKTERKDGEPMKATPQAGTSKKDT